MSKTPVVSYDGLPDGALREGLFSLRLKSVSKKKPRQVAGLIIVKISLIQPNLLLTRP